MKHYYTIRNLLIFLFSSLNVPHVMAIEEAKYDFTFIPWFLCRNEIIIDVEYHSE